MRMRPGLRFLLLEWVFNLRAQVAQCNHDGTTLCFVCHLRELS